MKTAGIVVIGNEILSGQTPDQNAAYLLGQLRDLGVDVRRVAIIPDELAAIRDEIRSLSGSLDYVFTSGGVGPTHDDVTIAGIASAFDRRIQRSSELQDVLEKYYQEAITDATLRMADLPEGAVLLGADRAWFPVIVVENVYVFPGVPEILVQKFERIKERFRDRPFHLVRVFLRADEGKVADLLRDLADGHPDLRVGSYPTMTEPGYTLKVTLESKDPGALEGAHALLLRRLESRSILPVEIGQ